MNDERFILFDGTPIEKDRAQERLEGRSCLYQRIRTEGHRPLFLRNHTEILRRTCESLTGRDLRLDPTEIEQNIRCFLAANRFPERSIEVTLELYPDDTSHIVLRAPRILLYETYDVTSLRPDSRTVVYEWPLGLCHTDASRAAHRLAQIHAGEATAVRKTQNGALLSVGDDPIFAIRGRTIVTPPIESGAADSVERQLLAAAAKKANLPLLEADILQSELSVYDELFFVDTRGITSFASCDGFHFMSLLVRRLADAMAAIAHSGVLQ